MYQLINVSKTYGSKNNQVNVLKNVNLTFPTKGLVSVVGKSGSGKSTLLNLLTAIDKPSKGTIKFLGNDIKHFTNKQKKAYQNQIIGVLFQHFNLFENFSSLENVKLPALISGTSNKVAEELARKLFKEFNLEYLLEQNFSTLSGGEKQRVALLRALINSPKVIIADEPTGALDTKNSIYIMEVLKKISNDHLVIIVSHNVSLIEKYEDYRININEGNISNLVLKDENINFPKLNKSYPKSELFYQFIKIHLKKHKIRNLIVGCSLSFSLLCLLLSFGYINGNTKSKETYQSSSLLYNSATISKKITTKVPDSPIVISKLTRPNLKDINFLKKEIPSIIVVNNYQAVFPSLPSFYFDNKLVNDIEFSSVYDFKKFKNLFITGHQPSLNFTEVVVNKEFINHFNYSNDNIINQKIKLSCSIDMVNQNSLRQSIKDEINWQQDLKIVGVVKEFAYLNVPRIYYFYDGLANVLKNYKLVNLSKDYGYDVFVDEMVSDAQGDNVNSGYSYQLFVTNLNEVNSLHKQKEFCDQNDGYSIESINYSIINSYNSLTDIISSSLMVFVVIGIIGAVLIISISSFASFTQNKKESAILSILGTRRFMIFHIFNIESILIALFSLLIAFLLAYPTSLLVNAIIEKMFGLINVVVIPFISYLTPLIILSSFLIATISTAIPFLFYEQGYLIEELKDE